MAGVERYFRQAKRQYLIVYLAVFVLVLLSAAVTRFDLQAGLAAIPRVVRWMASNLLPDAGAVSRAPDILRKLGDTVLVSVMATVVASGFSFLVALFGARTTSPARPLILACRFLASLFRNIPVVAWAMILMFSFGQSSFTGFLALFLETFGFLARAFMEAIDETSQSAVEALRAAGATYGQTIAQAVIPSTLPQIVSWMLYMVETNIRSATLVGMLTGSGIGFAFDLYYKSLNYPSDALVTLFVVAVVLVVESVSNRVRRAIL